MSRVFFLIFLIFSQPTFATDIYKFSAIPLHDKDISVLFFKPFLDTLNKVVSKNIQYIYIADHKLLIEEIKRNNIDIAYIGPLPYYEIKKYVQPLVVELEPDGKLSYRCVLFTTIDQDIKIATTTLNLALTNKHSTCGFLAAYHILKNYKIDIMKTRFSFIGPHVKVVEYILATKFNTGIVKESIFNKFKPVGLKSLAYSPEFSGFLIVVNPITVPLKDATAIKDKLLNLTDSEKKSLNFGKNGFAPFDKTHYNNLDTLIDDRIIRYINE